MMSLLLLAAISSEFEMLSKPKPRDLAVIDCQVKKSFLSYPAPSKPNYIGTEHWVFKVKKWGQLTDNMDRYVTDNTGRVYGGPLNMMYSIENGKIRMSFFYDILASGTIEIDAKSKGTGVLSVTEKMRHGDGEYQINGECKTLLKRAPKGSKL